MQAVHDVSLGELTVESHRYLRSLQRPLPNGLEDKEVVKLFATNMEVEKHNNEQLLLVRIWKIIHKIESYRSVINYISTWLFQLENLLKYANNKYWKNNLLLLEGNPLIHEHCKAILSFAKLNRWLNRRLPVIGLHYKWNPAGLTLHCRIDNFNIDLQVRAFIYKNKYISSAQNLTPSLLEPIL